MNEITVTKTIDNISANCIIAGQLSVASADNLHDGRWWISRVKIQGAEKGKGLGSELLQSIIKTILSYGPTDIIVAPGGYGEDEQKQFNFYKKNGFVDSIENGLLIYKQ